MKKAMLMAVNEVILYTFVRYSDLESDSQCHSRTCCGNLRDVLREIAGSSPAMTRHFAILALPFFNVIPTLVARICVIFYEKLPGLFQTMTG